MTYKQTPGYCCALLCFIVLSIASCGPAPKSQEGPTVIAGTIRYQQTNQLLEASLRMEPVDTTIDAVYPTLFGTAMAPASLVGPGRFKTRRTLAFPNEFRLTAPCPDGPNCPLDYTFTPPFSDSIPAAMTIGKSIRFPISTSGLNAQESLVVFFEPADRSTPRRIQLLGPTSSGDLTLRKEVFADIPAGDYQVYLVKQQLRKDSTANLVASLQTEYFTKSQSVKIME